MSGSLRILFCLLLLVVLLDAFPLYNSFSELEMGSSYNQPHLFKSSLQFEEDGQNIDKRALMRLGKRAMMRLGKRALMRLGEIPTKDQPSDKLICGVVEGFYGKPWSKQQRKNLFARLKELGLNTYFYAPKDDLKHRGQWRVLYTQDESEILSELITAAISNDIDFVYALSPGIDIHYSDAKDVEFIHEKLSQVRSLGCKSFALLFDDIETEMQACDKEKFPSFAAAQVSVTNDVFDYLSSPKFFFCPTEYCETRSVPTLEDSEYLKTIGEKLMPSIHVMWTGPQVISQYLTEDHIAKVASVIKRKPLIWDNLHANDYDPKRVFLGPFAGRSVQLKNHLSGLLLNPNGKFEANFIPFNTMSEWYAADADAPEANDLGVRMEAAETDTHSVNSEKPVKLYHPTDSLHAAIRAWILEFQKIAELLNDASLEDVEMASPKALTELVEAVVNEHGATSELNSLTPEFSEPMETHTSDKSESEEERKASKEESDQMDAEERSLREVEFDHLATFVDLYYLPFDNGRRGEEILENFLWMYENSWIMAGGDLAVEERTSSQEEWLSRYDTVRLYVQNLKGFFDYLGDCPNKQIVADLIPYIWEAHGTMSVVFGVLSWLKLGHLKERSKEQPRFWKTATKDEPWVTSGGFMNHIYKIIAGQGGALHELCTTKTMLPLSIVDFSIRPLGTNDLDKLSAMATSESDRTAEQNSLNVSLFLDKYVNFYTELDTNFIFATVDDCIPYDRNIVCCSIGVLAGGSLIENMHIYTIRLQEKYRNININGVNMNSIIDEIAGWFPRVPKYITDRYPSWIDVRFSATAYDAVPTKRMIHTLAISLSFAGSHGMFVTIPLYEEDKIQFFKNIGFSEITQTDDGNHMILARSISRCADNNQENSPGS